MHARYYRETRENASGDLVLNIDLWLFALAAYMHAHHGVIDAVSPTA